MQVFLRIFRPVPKNKLPLLDTSRSRPEMKRLLQKEKGFTIIEIMVVIVILGILASIAIGLIFSFREKAHIGSIKSDLSNSYKISAAIYADNPDEVIELDTLYANGFVKSEGVDINVLDGNWDTLSITGTHPNVLAIYELNNTGRIFKQ